MKIGYARVSSSAQNLDMQIDAFKKAGCEKIFIEKQSAYKKRPELEKAFEMLRPGDIFYIWAFDRLGRTMYNIFQAVKQLNDRNVILKVTSIDVDTSTPTGKIILWVFAFMAELENDLRKQRQKEGIEAARRRGQIIGRQPGLSDVNTVTAKRAEKLYNSDDYSIREICKILNISSRTLYKYLKYLNVEKRSDKILKTISQVEIE